jgi:hypothetical protein
MNQPVTAIATRVEERMRALAVPDDTEQIYGIAEKMGLSGLIPSSMKTVDAAFLAMMKGAEYGLLPQQALAGFYVIGNIAHPYGTCLAGIVKAAPSFEDEILGCIEGLAEMRYMSAEENPYKPGSVRCDLFAELQRSLKRRLARVEEKTGKDATRAMYFCGWSVMKRRDGEPVCSLFDSYDAQKGGLLDKDMWKKWPTRMHMHRAATFNRRDTFADSLMGLDVSAEEAMEFGAIDLGTQPAPVRPASAGPSAVLADLARPETATVVEVVQRPPPPTPPVSAAAHAEIYAVGGPAPATDIPLESEEKPVTESHMDDTPPPQQSGEAKAPNGTAQLKAAAKAAADAGLDAAKIGQEAIEVLFGVGIKAKDLGDGDKIKVAQAILGKVEEVASGDAGGADDAEF